MKADDVNISAGEIMQRMTMKVRIVGVRRLRVRIWLGLIFVRIGARIIGVGQFEGYR